MSCRIRQLTIRNFFEKLCEPIFSRLSLTEDPLFSGEESSAINVPVNTLFSQSLYFLRRLPIRTPREGKGLPADGEISWSGTRVNGFLCDLSPYTQPLRQRAAAVSIRE